MAEIDYRKGLLCALLVGFSTGASADDITVEEMDHVLASRICPSSGATVRDVSYRQHCGQDYDNVMSPTEVDQCQKEADRINFKIWAYNDFIRSCNSGQGGSSGGTIPQRLGGVSLSLSPKVVTKDTPALGGMRLKIESLK